MPPSRTDYAPFALFYGSHLPTITAKPSHGGEIDLMGKHTPAPNRAQCDLYRRLRSMPCLIVVSPTLQFRLQDFQLTSQDVSVAWQLFQNDLQSDKE